MGIPVGLQVWNYVGMDGILLLWVTGPKDASKKLGAGNWDYFLKTSLEKSSQVGERRWEQPTSSAVRTVPYVKLCARKGRWRMSHFVIRNWASCSLNVCSQYHCRARNHCDHCSSWSWSQDPWDVEEWLERVLPREWAQKERERHTTKWSVSQMRLQIKISKCIKDFQCWEREPKCQKCTKDKIKIIGNFEIDFKYA